MIEARIGEKVEEEVIKRSDQSEDELKEGKEEREKERAKGGVGTSDEKEDREKRELMNKLDEEKMGRKEDLKVLIGRLEA